jgi:hypothetical protein
MSLRRWLLAGALVAGGCASTYVARVSDRDVARLPPSDQQQIVAAQQQIPIASSNVERARLQRDEAGQFRQVALNEAAAAQSQREAARTAIVLARSTRDASQLRAAVRSEDLARDGLIAARAKVEYADRLQALRAASLDEALDGLRLARAEVEYRKASAVVHDGLATDVDLPRIAAWRDEAQTRLAGTRTRVAMLAGEVQQLHVAWNDRRRELNTAARDRSPPLLAPPPPRPLQPLNPPALSPPHGDVNDTPAVPESLGQPDDGPAPPP